MTIVWIVIGIIVFSVVVGSLMATKGFFGDLSNVLWWLSRKIWLIILVLIAIVIIVSIFV